MKGFGGPKPAEIRLGLGHERNLAPEVVPTSSQAGAYNPNDKQNTGYSGTPMWKLALERAQREQAAAAAAPTIKIPNGFKPIEQVSEATLPATRRPSFGRWYYSEKRQIFWSATDYKLYVLDPASRQPVELHEAITSDLRISVGACFHDNASQARHILVKDLVKAAQSLCTSIDHLDRPCAIYALYEGHRGRPSVTGTANSCAEFCMKNLHQKLLLKLAAFRGYWDDRRLEAVMRESFEEIDAEFMAKHGSDADGCCAVVVLVTGPRLVLASLGDVACVVCKRGGEPILPLKAHAVQDPDEEDDDDDDDDDGPAADGQTEAPIRWTRAFGDLDFKRADSVPRLSATPDVKVVYLDRQVRGVALVCRALYNAIGRAMAVSTVFKRSGGRPRVAAGALVDAAVQWLGQVGGDLGLGSIVAFLDGTEDVATSPPKRRKLEQPSQVRLRHILLKHRECKSTTDKVRNKQVKRTRGEAERLLRAVFEECEADPKRSPAVFTQRCRDLSECPSCLTAGELAGDLGWVKPGKNEAKFGPSFDAAAFALQVGQLSDLIDSDQGIHIFIRAA
mmetsp:Transcript_85070/g.237335  ORF Transcript_85070/g.237335 Transcript_85070/m.237335 type:complete len:563 (-) Transcript_85070:189-1877(-)|eukprot:CAMPEP_0117487424 /NCGR_PEP_ID=MMETSP0784-20121206/15988_1 /TAXON_ID=39447 /ORGANISM="" /LENGTH=562 /DNA_ID=CAMNT_0005282071 /DNA_START=58 /DNA_END=1746 /DNA_ORIENTATION=+